MQQYTPGDFLSLVSDLVPIYVHRYRWSEADHPRHEAGKSEGGQFRSTSQSSGATSVQVQQAKPPGQQSPLPQASEPSPGALSPGGQARSTRKREIAALPDTVQRGHALHLSALDANTKVTLTGLAGELGRLMAPVDQAETDADKEHAWSQVNKDAIRNVLSRINTLDRQYGDQNGNRVSDFVNANGMIPRFLAERLDSGRRFFDPEKIREKLSSSNVGAPAFSDDEESAYRQFRAADRGARAKMLEDPSVRSVIERKMGLTPQGSKIPDPQTGNVAADPSEIAKPLNEDIGQTFNEQTDSSSSQETKKESKKRPDLDPRLRNKMSRAIEKYINDDNPDAQRALEQAVPEAWRSMKSEIEEWNEGLKGIFGAINKGRGNSLNSMALKVSRAEDPMSIVGFDEYVDYARKNFPHIVANKWGEEEGLMEAFRTGVKKIPSIDSDEVIERAIDMLGPGFRQMLGGESQQTEDIPISEPILEGGIPFSVRAWMAWTNRPQKFTR